MQLHETPRSSPVHRVLVFHADALVAIGLAAALRSSSELSVFVNGVDLTADEQDHFDVVVTDHDTGLRLANARRAGAAFRPWPQARLVLLTAHDREHEVRRALELGVHGYLPLGCSVDEYVRAVRTVAAGARYLAPAIAQRMADSLTREALTRREAEVLGLLADGCCNKSIARELDIAVGTVKAHVKAIMAKLEASSRTQALSVAEQRGLVELSAQAVARPRAGHVGSFYQPALA